MKSKCFVGTAKGLCGGYVALQVPALRTRFLIQFPLRVNLLACPLEEQLASVQLHCLLTPLWAVGQQLDELLCHGLSVVTTVPFCHVQVVVLTYISPPWRVLSQVMVQEMF